MALDTELAAYLNTFSLRALPLYLPQTYALPAVTYQLVGTDRPTQLSGALAIAKSTVVLTAWSKVLSEVVTLAERLRNALHGYGPGTWGSTRVLGVDLVADTELFNPPPDSSSTGTFQRALTFEIWWSESLPTGSGA